MFIAFICVKCVNWNDLSPGFFHEIGSPEYDALLPSHMRQPGSRAAIGLDIHKVGTVSSRLGFKVLSSQL